MHCSTLDGAAFAHECDRYWRDWADCPEARGPSGLARFRETGCRVPGGMTPAIRPPRHEVVHVPIPEGLDIKRDGLNVPDGDIARYCRPEHGNIILVEPSGGPSRPAVYFAAKDGGSGRPALRLTSPPYIPGATIPWYGY